MSDIFVLEDFGLSLNPEAELELTDGLAKGEDPDFVRRYEERSASSASSSDSSLVSYTAISPNKSMRTAKIDRITIHHMAGNLTVEQCGAVFANASRKASSNYGIGTDGRVGLYVPESYRAWTSSSSANDNRAVTIEVANSVAAEPWPVSDAAYESLIRLCVDICQRNNIPELVYTGNTSGNLTMHCWFAATSCPGTYLKARFPAIAEEVNKRLRGQTEDEGYKQFCEYMERYMSEAVKSDPSPWAKASCDKAIQKGVMKGDGSGAYNFQRPLTREAYLVMQDREGLL